MGSCIIEKFGYYTELTEQEKTLLRRFEDEKEHYKAGDLIAGKGKDFDKLYIMYSGWGYVSTNLDKHLRSIFDIRMNSDFIGTSELSFSNHLYDFYALTDAVVCPFPKKHLEEMFNISHKLRDIFLMIISREKAIANERIMSIGRRTAVERVAHFIMEVALRFDMIGGQIKGAFDFPLTQEHIADILGLSPVHVSRAMSNLKENNYITYKRNTMSIIDKERLFNLSGFNPTFLTKPRTDLDYNSDNIFISIKTGEQ